MSLFLNVASCKYCQFQISLIVNVQMLSILDIVNCKYCYLLYLLTMQLISKCLTKVLDYFIANDSKDIARDYRLSQKTQQYLANITIVKREQLLREKLRKRRTNLFKKANELARIINSKIYVVVQHNNKYYTFNLIKESN